MQDLNKKLIREMSVILVIKIILILTIKQIWFDAPTIPKNFDQHIAERITGNPSNLQETR